MHDAFRSFFPFILKSIFPNRRNSIGTFDEKHKSSDRKVYENRTAFNTGIRLIEWLFILRFAQECLTYMETSPFPVKGCNISAFSWRSGILSKEGSTLCYTCCVCRLGFPCRIRKTAPFSRLLQITKRYGGSILAQNLMDLHSVASYGTQGDAEDLLLPGSSLANIGTWDRVKPGMTVLTVLYFNYI
jgi:hypothetical protein